MKILVSLAESIPPNIKDQLVINRKFWRDLPARLSKLPELKKGFRTGVLPKVTVHQNAVSYAKRNNLRVFVGYIIYRDNVNESYKIEVHSFCVDNNNRVVEPTEGFEWENARYVGMPVPEKDIPGLRYLTLFERMDYINKVLANHDTTEQA